MRRLLVLSLFLCAVAFWAQPAWGVSGGAYTTVNTAVDGPGHCKNGNPPVNCNIYDGKEYVWLNGGPSANGLGPDGEYFFVVLAPGGQPNPNDGGEKNLSDDFDAYTNRTFTVTGGEVSAYGGTHTYSPPLIRLFPYADTPNPGGVYIMAICYLGRGYPVEPRDCKYDAFKVQHAGKGKVQHVISGAKYFDANQNGQRDLGEIGLANWQIVISCSDGTDVTLTTNPEGDFSYTTTAQLPSTGSTTCTVREIQQTGFTQTGNTVDQSIAAGGATVTLFEFVYTVTLPNNAVSGVENLLFGNFGDLPPRCPPATFGTDSVGRSYLEVTVHDPDTGLGDIRIDPTRAVNVTVDVPPYYGVTTPIVIRATQIDPSKDFSLEFLAVDLAGNEQVCDPVAGLVVRESGVSALRSFVGLPQAESKLTIYNGDPGVRSVEVWVNGALFRLTGLRDGEARGIDVAAAMLPGAGNVVSLVVRGAPGASAMVVIST